jgi:hypothetical protein
MIVIINGVYIYHLEAEIEDDENIVVRVFEYGFAEGLRTKEVLGSGKKITLKFPNARIIYWETTKNTPDEAVLVLEFPDGGSYDYKVKTLKFLKHEIEELEKRKLAILLPFYVLKLRKKVVSAKTSQARAKLASEMKGIIEELTAATDRAAGAGLMNEADKRAVLEYTEMLYRELYKEYDEFKEADVMLQNTILTYSEEAERRGLRKGRKEGKVEGRMEGKAEGRVEGKAEGRAEGKEEMARKLLVRGDYSPEVISEIAELPVDRLKALMN